MSVLRKFWVDLKSVLVNCLAWLVILTLYTVPLGLLAIWRYFVNFLARQIHSDLILCSPNDTLLVHETPDKQAILTGGIILKVQGRIESVKLKVLFEELFLASEHSENYLNLYCDLVRFCGYLFKRQIVEKVKLENHFSEIELENGQDFKIILASWFQQKFLKGLPLWQMVVLNGKKSDDVSYLAFKAHHVLMDGYSFVHVLDKLTGVTSPGEWAGVCGTGMNNNVGNKTGKEVEPGHYSFWKECKILFNLPETVASFTLPNPSLTTSFPSSKNLSHFEMLPMACGTSALEPIKEIRRQLGVHFPSIIYGLQGGVLRRALLNSYPNIDKEKRKPFTEDTLPEYVLISTRLPVVGREHPRNKLTNHWSGGYIKVPLKINSPKERIANANKSLESLLTNEGTYVTWKYLAYLIWLFPTWFQYVLDKCTFLSMFPYRSSISCVPQSCLVQYNLMGIPVENIYHCPIMKDCFLTAVLLGCSSSHHDKVDFTLFGHPDWFPDQNSMDKVMSDYFHQELEALARECYIDKRRLKWRVPGTNEP